PPGDLTIDQRYAVYVPALSVAAVGSLPVAGRYGQLDLAGNVGEWVLDYVHLDGSRYPLPCVNCADHGPGDADERRGPRGGDTLALPRWPPGRGRPRLPAPLWGAGRGGFAAPARRVAQWRRDP